MDYSKPTDAFQKSPPPTAPPHYGGGQQQPPIGVPVQPPPAAAQQGHGGVPGPWSTGLCDCFSDVPNCCMTCWCPCVTFGQIAEIVDRGSTSCGASGALYALLWCFTGCACIYSCMYRSKMRKLYMLPDEPCGDCLVHCCCEACALCQEYRELKHRGFDMALVKYKRHITAISIGAHKVFMEGWHGNVERQNQGVTMAPVVQGGMSR